MDRDPSTRHVLEGRELIDYLVEKASSTTNAELMQREERRNRRSAAALSVLGFVGLGAIVGAIKMFVQQEIATSERRVAEQVRQTVHEELVQQQKQFEVEARSEVAAEVQRQVGEVRAELNHYKVYQELIAQAELVTAEVNKGKIPREPLRLSIEAINQLAGVATITDQFRFVEAVNAVVDVLVRTDRVQEIDDLEARLSHVLVKHRKISLDLTDHYGQLIVSSPYPIEKLDREYEALKRYAQASRELKYPEKALMWELFVAYKANGYRPTRTTETMVQMAQDLSDGDLSNFCYQVVMNSDPLHWMKTPDHEGRELAKLVRGLLNDHPQLRGIIAAKSVDPQLHERLARLSAKRLARLQAAPPAAPVEATTPPASPPLETAQAPIGANNTLRR